MNNIIDCIKVLTYIRRKHLSSEVMIPHSHNSWEIIYCTKGTIEIKSNLNNITTSNFIHMGQYAIVEPSIKHCLYFTHQELRAQMDIPQCISY